MLGVCTRFFSRGQFWPSGIVVACVCLCVCLCGCVNPQLVRAITHHPFTLGPPNLDHWCKRPWLRPPIVLGVIDLDLQGQIEHLNQNLPHFKLVRVITHYLFKLGSPNLDQKYKMLWLRSLLFWGWFNWHVKLNLISKSCLFASLLRLWNICETRKNGWKRSPFHILDGCAQICLPTGSCHGPWNSRIVSLVWPLLALQSSTRPLAMDFLMLL